MDKIVLFDIDNTLLDESSTHVDSFSFAFRKVYGVDASIECINHHGMTDQQIIIDVIKKNGVDERTIKSKLNECMSVMAQYFNENIGCENLIVLDGVDVILSLLDKRGAILGIVTGNIESIAWSKLKKTDLDGYFKFGGFGSDDIDRMQVVEIAVKRARDEFGFSGEIFVVGDTVHDIRAGNEAGMKTIGVATGIYSKDELFDAGADAVVDNLQNTENVLKSMDL